MYADVLDVKADCHLACIDRLICLFRSIVGLDLSDHVIPPTNTDICVATGSPTHSLHRKQSYACQMYLSSLLSGPLECRFQLTTSNGLRKSMDSRHQMALAISSMTTTVGLILVLIPTFVLRNAFAKTVKAIPAINQNLQVQLGSGFTQLYVVCVLGGLILVQCLLLISEDLRFPWWFSKQEFLSHYLRSCLTTR